MMQPQRSYPAKVNIYNLRSFFDFKPVNANQIIPGMILQFKYRSPEGVHDVSPLIYVLEATQDRIWGLNLHYKFALLGEVIQDKRGELAKTQPSEETEKPEVKPALGDPTPRPEQLNQKYVPSLAETKAILAKGQPVPAEPEQKKKIIYPPQLLEHYNLVNQPKELLRNYLYPRISGVQKLVFKAL
jgi:hypothetical protein